MSNHRLVRIVAGAAVLALPVIAPLHGATEYTYGFENVAVGSYTSTKAAQWPQGIRSFTSGSNQHLTITDTTVKSGSRSLRMNYKQGEWAAVKGQFYAWATRRQEYTLTYYMKFHSFFEFGRGGKLPGLAGEGEAVSNYANGCSTNRGGAWSTRYMWREGGHIRAYVYHNDRPDDCGEYMGTGWYAPPNGPWFSLRQRVKTNTGNNQNGILQIWCNGASTPNFSRTNLRYTTSGKQIDQIFFSTFFGGSTSDWASPINQSAWWDDFTLTY